MKLVSQAPYVDPASLAWVYVALDEEGQYWIRSIAGNWTQIDAPAPTDVLSAEFEQIQPSSPEEVKTDDDRNLVVPVEP